MLLTPCRGGQWLVLAVDEDGIWSEAVAGFIHLDSVIASTAANTRHVLLFRRRDTQAGGGNADTRIRDGRLIRPPCVPA